MKILWLVLLILLSIASYMSQQYLWYDHKASFSYIYTYFFGSLFVASLSFWSFIALGIYAYALNGSTKSTSLEKLLAKVVLVIFSIISIIYIGNYFGLNMEFFGINGMQHPYE